MNIQPPRGGQTPRTGPERLAETPTPAQAEREPKAAATPATPASPPRDSVELSDSARRLEELLRAENVSISQLDPARLREVLDRLAAGFYDRPEVRDEVLRRLAADVLNPPAEG